MIRSQEASTLFLNLGDAASYTALPMPKGWKGPRPRFSSFKEHPFASHPTKNTPSGAYGNTLPTWKSMISNWVAVPDGKDTFDPAGHDRIAIAIMEMHPGQGWGSAAYQTELPTSLALVRLGKIEEAAKQLAATSPIQWTSLPGGSQSAYTVAQMMNDSISILPNKVDRHPFR